jgi:hypothetical protein
MEVADLVCFSFHTLFPTCDICIQILGHDIYTLVPFRVIFIYMSRFWGKMTAFVCSRLYMVRLLVISLYLPYVLQ